MSATTDNLCDLVDAVRRRLWLQACVDAAVRGLRLGGAVLLAGGAYHLLAHAVPVALVAALALLPLAAELLVGLLRRRPGRAAAARIADQWFDGKNLLASAWELRRRAGATSATAELVVARARTAARQWLPRLPAEHPVRRPQAVAVPIMLALIGAFLLQLPSKEWLVSATGRDDASDAAPVRLATPENGAEETAAPSLPAATAAPAAFDAAARRGGAPAAPTTADLPPQFSTQPGAAGAPVSAAVANAQSAPPGQMPATSSVSANAGGKRAGDQAGVRADAGVTATPPPLPVSEVGVQRAGGTGGSSGKGNELAQAAIAPAPPDTLTVPAARHAGAGVNGGYPPALRAYMARYFSQLNQRAPQP
jgi:hypothetical protein